MKQKIIILDFGSQTTQLIGRRVRELDTFCEILPYNKFPVGDPDVIGVILSGSPYSVHDPEAFKVDLSQFVGKVPVLGICYGAQFIANTLGGKVEKADSREYGRAHLESFDASNPLFRGIEPHSQVWMSHGDTITAIPESCRVIASTADVTNAAYASTEVPLWAVQFHPEVFHSLQGKELLRNFVVDICGSTQDWSPASFVETTVEQLKEQLGTDRVILGLSGGVDSSVCAVLLNRAIGDRLTCIFVDHGMLRKNEFNKVMDAIRYLREKELSTVESLDAYLDTVSEQAVFIRAEMKPKEKRMKEIDTLLSHIANFEAHKPVHTEYAAIRFKKPKQQFAAAHRDELDAYNAAVRYFKVHLEGSKYSTKKLNEERTQLAGEVAEYRERLSAVQEDVKILRDVRHWINQVLPSEQYRQTVEPGKKPSIHQAVKGRAQRIREEQAEKRQQPRTEKKQDMEL